MEARQYTTTEVAELTGFSSRQLDYWARQGIIVPSIRESYGPGSRRLYSFEDLIQLRFFRRLKLHGWSTQKISAAIKILRVVMEDPSPLKSAVLIHNPKTILAICKTKEGERVLLDTLDPGGQQVMSVLLENLVQETLESTQQVSESVVEVIDVR